MDRLYLREWRKHFGMTVRGLVDASGVELSGIVRIENGTRKNPGIFTVKKLADTLGISLLDLLKQPPKKARTPKRDRK